MADMNKPVPPAGGTPPVSRGDRVKANLSFTFGLIAVIGGSIFVFVSLIALVVREGTLVFFNTVSIAGIALSITGMIMGGKVSSMADPQTLKKAATGKTLSIVGLVLNIIATVLLIIGIIMLLSLVASGDYTFHWGY